MSKNWRELQIGSRLKRENRDLPSWKPTFVAPFGPIVPVTHTCRCGATFESTTRNKKVRCPECRNKSKKEHYVE